MSIIYHYCDANAFLSIIHNKKLWLSATNNMNDYKEIDYFLDKAWNKINAAFPEEYDFKLRTFWDERKLNLRTPYVCSFSKKGDVLSQWRAYANDGKGFAIGFDRDLFSFNNRVPTYGSDPERTVGLKDVIYDTGKEIECIQQCIELLEEAFKSSSYHQNFIIAASRLNHFAMFSKSQAFIEEDEVRMIHTPRFGKNYETGEISVIGHISPLKHRVSGDIITSYFEYDFSETNFFKPPIKEIILGPKCKVSNYDLELLLSTAELSNVIINRSSASYR